MKANKRRRRWNAYILEVYWNRQASSDALHWSKVGFLAYDRRDAFKVVQPEIREVLADLPEDVVYVSVFLGTNDPGNFAGRQTPVQVTRTGDRRFERS